MIQTKFKTRKQLKREIVDLSAENEKLKREKRISAFIENLDIPKCENVLCEKCVYSVIRPVGRYGADVVVGCGKTLKCKDFTPKSTIVLSPNSARLFR